MATSYLQFNGINQQGSVADAVDLRLTNNWEITLTFAPANLDQTSKYLLLKGSNDYSLIWEYTDNKVEIFSLADPGSLRTASSVYLPDTSFHTIKYTMLNGTFSAYLDGTLVTSVSTNIAFTTSASTFYFASAGGSNYVAGNFSYLAIKNNGVMAAEYLFNEGSGSVANDNTGNGHVMTLTNSPTWGTISSVAHSGASSLDGNGSLTATASIVSQNSASLSGNGSISADLTQTGSTHSASSSLSGIGTLSSDSIVHSTTPNGSANLQGNGTLMADATVTTPSVTQSSSASLQGNGTLTASADVSHVPTVYNGSVSLSGKGSLSSRLSGSVWAEANLSSDSSLIVLQNVSQYGGDGKTIAPRPSIYDWTRWVLSEREKQYSHVVLTDVKLSELAQKECTKWFPNP